MISVKRFELTREEANVTAIPAAKIVCTPNVADNGTPFVMALTQVLSVYSIPCSVISYCMSTSDARELAAQLMDAADKAEIQARKS